MTSAATPTAGRRVTPGALAVLVGYLLLAPPLFLVGPFALLTLLARPKTAREILWLAASGLLLAGMLSAPLSLGSEIFRASGLVATGVFVLLSIRGQSPAGTRAILAVAIATIGVILWARTLGIAWGQVEAAFAEMLRESYQTFADALSKEPGSSNELRTFMSQLQASAPSVARVIPGMLGLQAIAGLVLAADWHHRIAEAPIGVRPGRFRDFRFNDHLVWGAIFTLGLLLVPLPAPTAAIAENLLVVWVGLYAVRGLAVVVTLLAPASPVLKLLAGVFVLLVAPLALGAFVAIGLADTWLDIRGRFVPPAPSGA
ncbi:MAG: DUF2232 domain-containing protein [Gemmatimonadales bacterium]|nr:DUF2232 domain-containing protein [Gemmatimonadales bacterium]